MSTRPRSSPLIRHKTKRYPVSAIEEGLTVLQLLSATRFATGIQIERAIFASRSLSARQARFRATRSLRRLFDAGLVRRVTVLAASSATGKLSRQIVHCLSAKGAVVVGQEPRQALTRAPKDMQVCRCWCMTSGWWKPRSWPLPSARHS